MINYSHPFRCGIITRINLSQRSLLENNFFLGYKINDYDFTLKIDKPYNTDEMEERYLRYLSWRFALRASYNYNSNLSYGLELKTLKQNAEQKRFAARGLVSYKIPDICRVDLSYDTNHSFRGVYSH